MKPAIVLSVDCEYPVLPKGDFISIRIVGIGPNEAVAFYEYGDEEGLCVLVHLHDGVADRYELRVPPKLLLEGTFQKRSPVLMRVGGQLLLLVNLRLLYVVDPTLRVLKKIAVANELPVLKEVRPDLYPDTTPGFSDTNIVPLFFPGNWIAPRAISYMAMLQINFEDKCAEWLEMHGKLLFRFKHSDFPATHLGNNSPLIHHAIYRNENLQIYTIGNSSNYIKYGMPYFRLATFDQRRKLIDRPYFEHPPGNDPKKHGRYGDFTSSLQYCIITPVYTSSDPWKRKQCLFDLVTKQLHEVTLPRGFSKHQVVEHAHNTYWLLSQDSAEHFQITSCSQR